MRVRLSETDSLGVVYYGQYFTYFDVARLEMLRSAGLTLKFLKLRGMGFVAAQASCRYVSSAKFDDLLTTTVEVRKVGRSSVAYAHMISVGSRIVAEGSVTDVLVDARGKPKRIPADIKEMLGAA